ncbi:protein neprosin-like [Setaria viridis]|uniref:protein neprosin-like n=1 Tax=Setaria viridis TaxID=4556 RepID=UPI003B3A6BFB
MGTGWWMEFACYHEYMDLLGTSVVACLYSAALFRRLMGKRIRWPPQPRVKLRLAPQLSNCSRKRVRARRSAVPEQDEMALERELMMLNKPYVKSFKDKYGVVFYCIDMYKQPAFDHPLLKNHKLQVTKRANCERIRVHPQESCPDGTVLIRRTLKQHLVNASVSLPRFRPQKDHSEIPGQHFAQLLVDSVEGSKFQAAGANMEVDNVAVPAGQVSSAQILLVDDSCHSSVVSVVQSGWSEQSIHKQGDSQTRFMTLWTADDCRMTGCLNTLCRGFVVVSQTAAPAIVLRPGFAGISISKDGLTGNWQVFLNQEMVGYFPKELINNMAGATQVQMGGITYAPPSQKSPPMGTRVAPVPGKVTLASKFAQGQGAGR